MTIPTKTNLREFINNFLFNINRKYQILRNSDFFLTPFHQIFLGVKQNEANNHQNEVSSLIPELPKDDISPAITIESIYLSFLNDLIPTTIDLLKYHNQLQYVQANYTQNKRSFYSIYQQKTSSFNCLETVFLNRPSLFDKTVFEIQPIDYVNFGLIYLKGEIVLKNIDRALRLFTKASSLSESWFYIAICCLSDEKGNDIESAKKFFKLSADKGHSIAAFNYARLTDSVDYYKLAADRGVKESFFYISRFYLNKGEVEKAIEFAEIGVEKYKERQCIKNLEFLIN